MFGTDESVPFRTQRPHKRDSAARVIDSRGACMGHPAMGDSYGAAQIGDAVKFYGQEGQGGPTVGFIKGDQGRATPISKNAQITAVKIDLPSGQIDPSIVGHEGTHGADLMDGSHKKMSRFQMEYRAYQTASYILQAQCVGYFACVGGASARFDNAGGMISAGQLWNSAWGDVDLAVLQIQRDGGIRGYLASDPAYSQLKPSVIGDPKR
jgi:hypothetical protein